MEGSAAAGKRQQRRSTASMVSQICKDLSLNGPCELLLDGFLLRPVESAEVVVRDGDLLVVQPISGHVAMPASVHAAQVSLLASAPCVCISDAFGLPSRDTLL